MTDHSKTALILGATSDIGRALARAFARRGNSLILAAREPDDLTSDAADLRLRFGVTVAVAAFDLLDIESFAPLLASMPEPPNIVVMVAGLLGEQARSEADTGAAERVVRTNYLGPILLLGEIGNQMERRGNGIIIGISSVAGDRGRASNYIYGSAKAGFSAFLSGLRNRLASAGVRVITVKPGFVRTRMTEEMTLPAWLTAEPEEVAEAILGAIAHGRDVVYVRRIWRLVMALISLVPERLFKRLRL
ncbi:MAG TPA: SDR family oxidoreductase [Aliidongia sp.]|nr:SDR family oxidoreductase [Aliidongia sp.]